MKANESSLTDKRSDPMSRKILIVDDEPNIAVPLQFLMEQNAYDVRTIFVGQEAIRTISEYKPDLILLDIMPPQLDGFEICQIVRRHPELWNIKIIFLTAMGRDADRVKGMALGADAYIIKPFSNSDVMGKVRELLR